MASLLAVEFNKLLKRWQTYLGYAALLLIMLLTLWANLHFKRHMHGEMLDGPGITVVGSPVTGTFFAYWTLTAASWLVVLFSAYVAGNALAGEWATGTLRTILARPVGRLELVFAKWVVTSVYALSLICFLVGGSLALGWIFLGGGDLVATNLHSLSQGEKIVILPADMALARFGVASLLFFVWVEALVGVALLVSSVLKSGPSAIIVTFGILLTMAVLGLIPLEALQQWRPYFITSYYLNWQSGFAVHLDWMKLLKENYYALVYGVSGLVLTCVIFSRRDVLA